jgi:hypothetical protein
MELPPLDAGLAYWLIIFLAYCVDFFITTDGGKFWIIFLLLTLAFLTVRALGELDATILFLTWLFF